MLFLGRVTANEEELCAMAVQKAPSTLPHIRHAQGPWPFFGFLLDPHWGGVECLTKQQVARPSATTCGGPALLDPSHTPVTCLSVGMQRYLWSPQP